jgi:hypothetical protein
MHYKRLSYKMWVGLSVFGFDVWYFCNTNPNRITSGQLIVAVGLLMTAIYCVLRLMIALLGLAYPWFNHQKRVVIAITVAIAVLLALQSIGQLSLRDALVLIGLSIAVFGYLKLTKQRPISNR